MLGQCCVASVLYNLQQQKQIAKIFNGLNTKIQGNMDLKGWDNGP